MALGVVPRPRKNKMTHLAGGTNHARSACGRMDRTMFFDPVQVNCPDCLRKLREENMVVLVFTGEERGVA